MALTIAIFTIVSTSGAQSTGSFGAGPCRVWDVFLAALNESGGGQDSVQINDSTVVRAHQHAAGAQKMRVLRTRFLAARAVIFCWLSRMSFQGVRS